MADEQQIRKLEKILDDNASKTRGQIEELQNELEAERRKSMMDEQKAIALERELNEKVYLLNHIQEKKGQDDKEIQFLKDEIEKERRKSQADEGMIRKL